MSTLLRGSFDKPLQFAMFPTTLHRADPLFAFDGVMKLSGDFAALFL
jgi:hypothetical protein